MGTSLHLHSKGWDVEKVVSGSMEPTIGVNDIIVVAPPTDVRLGDVVMYHDQTPAGEPRLTAHRLIGYEPDGSLRTKGDNNTAVDVHTTPLTMQDVAGEVRWSFAVPLLGSGSPLVFGLGLVALVSLLYIVMADGPKKDSDDDEQDGQTSTRKYREVSIRRNYNV